METSPGSAAAQGCDLGRPLALRVLQLPPPQHGACGTASWALGPVPGTGSAGSCLLWTGASVCLLRSSPAGALFLQYRTSLAPCGASLAGMLFPRTRFFFPVSRFLGLSLRLEGVPVSLDMAEAFEDKSQKAVPWTMWEGA